MRVFGNTYLIRPSPNVNLTLEDFCAYYNCTPTLLRPNTTPHFPVFNALEAPMDNSPSPFVRDAWARLLAQYPGDLPALIYGILTYGCSIGYQGPEVRIRSKNLETASLDPRLMTEMLRKDLAMGRVIIVNENAFPFISSPLGFVPKQGDKLRRIHHLSYPRKTSTNNGINRDYGYLEYIRIWDVVDQVLKAGRGCFIMKRDMEAAFRNIPVASAQQWLLGFHWHGQNYKERCLPFGLRTAPFIFNLFAEALQWLLHSWLQWDMVSHLLDDVIHIIPENEVFLLDQKAVDYIRLCNVLGIPMSKEKDAMGQVVTVLGYEIDTIHSMIRLPPEKLAKAVKCTQAALAMGSMTLWELQVLTGYLSWCAPAVQLGWVFCRRLWDWQRDFKAHKRPRERIPRVVREDLTWWDELLPQFNGTRFFETKSRAIFHLFTDGCIYGIGGFFYAGRNGNWHQHLDAISRSNCY
jgi:hypothetical protein